MKRALRLALAGTAMLTFATATRDAAAEAPPACAAPKTTCAGHAGYYASSDDLDRLTAVADPLLRDVRTCLDGMGAKGVASVLLMRWDSDGQPVEVKLDVPGYEGLPCVQKAQAKLSKLQNPHETSIRCEFGCPRPTPAPAPPPVVVTPPPTPTPAPAPAPAPAPTTTTREAPHYEKVWYGYQTLVIDGIALATLLGGVASKSGPVTGVGLGTYVLGTPIVHMAHGNIGPGFGSLGLRLIVPLIGSGIGAIAGLIVGSSQQQTGNVGTDSSNVAQAAGTGALVGAFVGGAGCVLIDALGFAYTKERVDDHATTQAGLRMTPTFAIQKDLATAGVVGQF